METGELKLVSILYHLGYLLTKICRVCVYPVPLVIGWLQWSHWSLTSCSGPTNYWLTAVPGCTYFICNDIVINDEVITTSLHIKTDRQL